MRRSLQEQLQSNRESSLRLKTLEMQVSELEILNADLQEEIRSLKLNRDFVDKQLIEALSANTAMRDKHAEAMKDINLKLEDLLKCRDGK